MPRGGRRKGTPGVAYPNRTDMQTTQPVTTVPGQPYGQAAQQQQAQRVAPLAGQGANAPRQGAAAPRQSPTQQRDVTQQPQQGFGASLPPPFARPTEKPNEPLMAGAPLGPGPGPQQPPTPRDNLGLFLRELYRAQPSEDVRQLIVQHEANAPPQMGPAPVAPSGPAVPPQMGTPPAGTLPPPPGPPTEGPEGF